MEESEVFKINDDDDDVSFQGGSNMVGRAFFGFLASRKCVNVLHMNSLCLVGSALSMLYLVHCTSFEMLVVFSIIFGFIFGESKMSI